MSTALASGANSLFLPESAIHKALRESLLDPTIIDEELLTKVLRHFCGKAGTRCIGPQDERNPAQLGRQWKMPHL
jgi:hypothetical protein